MEKVITAHLKDSYINLLFDYINILNSDYNFVKNKEINFINEYILLRKNDQKILCIQLVICQGVITVRLPKKYFKWINNILVIHQTSKRTVEWYHQNGRVKSIQYSKGFDIFYDIDNNESLNIFFKNSLGYQKISNKHHFFFRDQGQLNLYRWI